jgi:hypothetical protein
MKARTFLTAVFPLVLAGFLAGAVQARQTTGTPGSPDATTTSKGNQLPPFALTAKFHKLTIKIDRPQLSPEEIKKLEEGMKKAAMGIQ